MLFKFIVVNIKLKMSEGGESDDCMSVEYVAMCPSYVLCSE